MHVDVVNRDPKNFWLQRHRSILDHSFPSSDDLQSRGSCFAGTAFFSDRHSDGPRLVNSIGIGLRRNQERQRHCNCDAAAHFFVRRCLKLRGGLARTLRKQRP